MKKNNKTPKLRFSGYTDDWEQRKFKELCDMVTVGVANSATHAYSDSGIVMFRNQNIKPNFLDDTDIIHINPEFEVKYKNKRLRKNDLLVARTGYPGTACVVPGKYENSQTFTTLIARPKKRVNSYFLCQYLNSDVGVKYFESTQIGGGQKNSGAGILNEMPVTLPPAAEEEKRIADFFTQLDHLITLHQHKLEKLQNMKKSCLQKMFPKDGATVPEIRFSEFQGDWEERTLGSCFDERLESLPDGELLSVTIGSGIKKFSELDRHDNSNTDKSKYKRVCIGDIAYNSMRMWQGASGRSPYEGIVSPAYTVVKPIGDIDTQFFAYMFKKKEIIHLFEINSQGLTSDTWNLKYPAFSKIVVRVPRNVEEQSRIARFLLELDELISCTEQEIEITKRMKKGCLQKMFV